MADGLRALYGNTIGTSNTASGDSAAYHNTTGVNKTATGYVALFNNTTGSNNIALGNQAGQNLTTSNINIAIGNAGIAGDANTIRIGTQGTQTIADGRVNTVRYEPVNAMLLNEFLKGRCQIDVRQKQIDALTAGLQKVSA